MLGIILLLIVVGIIGAVAAHFIGAAQAESARLQYTQMPLPELQAAPPPTKLVIGVTQKTIYGNDRMAWFAALLERTLGEATGTKNDLEFLGRHYGELLRQLREYLTTSFPTVWVPAEPEKPVRLILNQQDAYYSVVTDRTLLWLGEMAERQKVLAAQSNRGMEQWDSSLFSTKTSMVLATVPLAPSQSVLETPCTLARLDQEIHRLGGIDPATTATGGDPA
jgi:hypothetical protein